MKNWNNKIIKLDNKYYLLNTDFANAKELTLTDTNEIEEVQGTYYIYLVNDEHKQGKCFNFENINLASKMYNEYMSSLSEKYMTHSYIEQGFTIEECNSFRIRYDKNESTI